jgi:hypothetical protein
MLRELPEANREKLFAALVVRKAGPLPRAGEFMQHPDGSLLFVRSAGTLGPE